MAIIHELSKQPWPYPRQDLPRPGLAQASSRITLLSLITPFPPTLEGSTPSRCACPRPQVSMLAVDEMYDDLAMLEKDLYWDATEARAPYTAATAFLLQQPSFQGSTFDIA